MSIALKIQLGTGTVKGELAPVEKTFPNEGEKDAFIEGVEHAVDAYPEDVDVEDVDISDLSEEEQKQFMAGVEVAEGFSEYEVI